MKLVINYDLIDKINEAQGKCKLQRYMKTTLKCYFYGPLGMTIANLIQLGNNEITVDRLFTNTAISLGIVTSCSIIVDKLITKLVGKTSEQMAIEELNKLSLQLNQLNIKTSEPLLLDAEEYYKEHKFILSDNGVPSIMQNKFINIPTYDDGNIKEISILQEHKIGSKQYVLSLGSPTKSRVLKPAYGM